MDQFLINDFLLDNLMKLGFALLLGGLIGFEREVRDKAAGFRTMILICTGAALFTMFSLELGSISHDNDATRVAANIVSGIGFLGAGVILREGGEIRGLTTASTIWLVAALGMGIGAGKIVFSACATLIVLIVLWVFPRLEIAMEKLSDTNTYELVFSKDLEKLSSLEEIWGQHRLRVLGKKRTRLNDRLVCEWTVAGSPKNHKKVIDLLLNDTTIDEFRY